MMKRISLAALLLCAVSLPLSAAKANVRITNLSDYTIHHLFLSPVSEDKWGADQLRDDVIESEASFTITGIPCDSYDVKVVDEDGDECVIEEVDICGDGHHWKITNEDLLDCEGYGK
jgi:hypothetical protein